MHIAQLLDVLSGAPEVEVVEVTLPELSWPCLSIRTWRGCPNLSPSLRKRGTGNLQRLSCHPLFQHLEHGPRIPSLGSANQQMEVFRHDHIPIHEKPVPLTHLLQDGEKQTFDPVVVQKRPTAVATAGNEV